VNYLVKIRSAQTPLNGQFSIGANTRFFRKGKKLPFLINGQPAAAQTPAGFVRPRPCPVLTRWKIAPLGAVASRPWTHLGNAEKTTRPPRGSMFFLFVPAFGFLSCLWIVSRFSTRLKERLYKD